MLNPVLAAKDMNEVVLLKDEDGHYAEQFWKGSLDFPRLREQLAQNDFLPVTTTGFADVFQRVPLQRFDNDSTSH